MKKELEKPELLAPAGSLAILKIAFMYGADAVYCGTSKFAMRNRVGFTYSDLRKGIEYAHKIGKKIYVTVNAFPHSGEIEEAQKYALKVTELKPDALIVADPGMVDFVLKNTNIPIHLSTQANTTNHLAAKFWQNQGVERIVLARELSLKDITLIHKECPSLPIETFVHGAMCMAYSGRCQISNYMTGRDPNKGACIQACRFKYKMYGVEEDLRKGELFPIYEDETGSYLFNSKDLCMIEYIPELVKAGVKSFKIEGRLKTEYYVATTVKSYREAIDLYFGKSKEYEENKGRLLKEVSKATNREFTTGFYFEKPAQSMNNYETSKAKSDWGYIGQILNYNKKKKILIFECKNHLKVGSVLEILAPKGIIEYELSDMTVNGISSDTAHANNIVEILLSSHLVEKGSLIRVRL